MNKFFDTEEDNKQKSEVCCKCKKPSIDILLEHRGKKYCENCHPDIIRRKRMKENYIKFMADPMKKFISLESELDEAMKEIGIKDGIK